MLKKLGYIVIGFILLLIVWQLIIQIGRYEEALLPSPLSVAKAILTLIVDGTLWVHLRVSLLRFAIGYLLAIIPAIILGMLLGRMRCILQIVDPIIQVLRPVSPIAWSPFIVLWFGIGDMPAIVIIFIAAFFPVLLTTISGVKKIDQDYLKIAENLEVRRLDLFVKFIFPAVFPAIVSGLHIALGTAWIFLVSGEMVGAQSGLGFLIVDARNTLNLDFVLAGIIFIGVIGLILDRLVGLFEQWVGRHWGTVPRN
ncbi:ABC transporter permease [Lederbergia galactosidilytica]|uniref:Sulfonate ABC transporter permease n=1 Tax=Lederbergia galactosidilytica TaxID=217031 RepID=A0A0Q9YCM3_9BACI|nr:ABC transporter permease [Lederbergia galactosidilytica]KRG14423.1 sulfonate ABC transporter permease [Lederbergia galactosidilytica]KRG14833.1 sulfonate ABC transporter permease [Virgibacillus soli]MBP1914505.1 NitT/TauT family transport system permease protein [Lederbergia galactosidilytica]OAK69081.1 sulfonate ABC transporter permease [Lederbergia galactosidilytica]